MKKATILTIITALLTAGYYANAQQNNRTDLFNKANNTANKISNIIAVFQPYLLKARELFYDGKQLVGDVKNSAKNAFGNNSNNTGQGGNLPVPDPSNPAPSQASYPNNNGSATGNYGSNSSGQNAGSSSTQTGQVSSGYNNNSGNAAANSPQNYLAGQSLPVNNPSTVNNDGTGNWGNQNNGLYGNCLDVMTGSVMGMGDAAQTPASVDLMFFAPADGQNTYYLMTPGFAKSNSTAGYMTEHVSEQVMQWTDVNESEVALTKLTIGQFNQIQNNGQIQSAVRNAQDYSGNYASVGQKLDGQVFAVKMQMDNREVYGLVAVIKQMGTSGSSGYLKIKIKSTGIDLNKDGQADASAYQR